MSHKLRSTGIIFASAFLVGYIINFYFAFTRGDGLFMSFFQFYQLLLIAAVALFTLSAFIDPLRWVQPALFLILSPVAIVPNPRDIYGLGFFIMGVFLLERAGFFLRHRSPKALTLVCYLLVMEILSVTVSKRPLADAVSPTFFIAALLFFLWFLYKDRLVVFLKEPKQKISLVEKGLSPAECSYIMEVVRGKQQKEIAIDFELSESTVRNTLARAYKKLDVEDKAGLAVLAERFEIID